MIVSFDPRLMFSEIHCASLSVTYNITKLLTIVDTWNVFLESKDDSTAQDTTLVTVPYAFLAGISNRILLVVSKHVLRTTT